MNNGKFFRVSRYRHVFGRSQKKDECYENLKISKNAWDSNIIKTSGKYISVNWESQGGGAFAVIGINDYGKAPNKISLFRGHKSSVLDTAFDPFDDQKIASCSDDSQIMIWKIPENYSFKNYFDEDGTPIDITQPLCVLSGHSRRVGQIEYHPCAKNVLVSSSIDKTVKVWDTEKAQCYINLQHNDLIYSFCFNYNGSMIATSSRDKKIRIWDIRSSTIVSEGNSHDGPKPCRIQWLGKNDRVITTGFSKQSDRQIGIWDINNIQNGPINGFVHIDSSSGVLIPYFDISNSIMYLAGKGDGNIRYFEYDKFNDKFHELSQFLSVDPQRGFAVAPNRYLSMKNNEILKCYKSVNNNLIEPISFFVPRRSENFQEDLYPDCFSQIPALTADEWFNSKNVSGPILLSLKDKYLNETKTNELNLTTIIDHSEPMLKKPISEISINHLDLNKKMMNDLCTTSSLLQNFKDETFDSNDDDLFDFNDEKKDFKSLNTNEKLISGLKLSDSANNNDLIQKSNSVITKNDVQLKSDVCEVNKTNERLDQLEKKILFLLDSCISNKKKILSLESKLLAK